MRKKVVLAGDFDEDDPQPFRLPKPPDDDGVEPLPEDKGVNAKLKWGYTKLHFAAIEGNEAECDKLLAMGANKKPKTMAAKCLGKKR